MTTTTTTVTTALALALVLLLVLRLRLKSQRRLPNAAGTVPHLSVPDLIRAKVEGATMIDRSLGQHALAAAQASHMAHKSMSCQLG